MEIPGKLLKRLRDTLVAAFTYPELEQWTRFHLDTRLDAITPSTDLNTVVFQLLKKAELGGWLRELVTEAKSARPKVDTLQTIAEEVLAQLDPNQAYPPGTGGPRA